MIDIKRGDIVMAKLTPELCVQGGMRPVLIMQNDIGNKYSPTTIIVPLTSELKKTNIPTHEVIEKKDAPGLSVDSMALCEQIRTIDKRKIKEKIGRISTGQVLDNVSRACRISLGDI